MSYCTACVNERSASAITATDTSGCAASVSNNAPRARLRATPRCTAAAGARGAARAACLAGAAGAARGTAAAALAEATTEAETALAEATTEAEAAPEAETALAEAASEARRVEAEVRAVQTGTNDRAALTETEGSRVEPAARTRSARRGTRIASHGGPHTRIQRG